MELFFYSLKSEWVPNCGYANYSEANSSITNYIIGYYSQPRPYQYNGGLTLDESERLSGKTLKLWPVFVDHFNSHEVELSLVNGDRNLVISGKCCSKIQ